MRLNNNRWNLKKNTNRNGGYVFSGKLKVDFFFLEGGGGGWGKKEI